MLRPNPLYSGASTETDLEAMEDNTKETVTNWLMIPVLGVIWPFAMLAMLASVHP